MNTVEFAVEDGVPYAIDFMNPAPDADLHSVGQKNFDWIVDAVAALAVKKAKSVPANRSSTGEPFLAAASERACKEEEPGQGQIREETQIEKPATVEEL